MYGLVDVNMLVAFGKDALALGRSVYIAVCIGRLGSRSSMIDDADGIFTYTRSVRCN